VLKADSGTLFLDHQAKSAIPILESQDGLCRLAIIGPLNLIELTQWYDFQAKPNGVLESDPHPPGTVEHLYMLKGEVEITVGEEVKLAKAGEAIRYRADVPHKIKNTGEGEAHANMILMLRQLGNPA
ncbi:MAG: cupin domain-containing protein, partial [Aestuariivirga sp.]